MQWPIPQDHEEQVPVRDLDAVIVHTLPGDCHRVLEIAELRRGAGPKLIAYTTWEALTAPQEIVRPLYDSFDEVWTPSQPSARAFGANGLHGTVGERESASMRTRVIPHCYDDAVDRPSDEYSDPDKFRFYWVGAWSARKNPGGLIRAFALAFYPSARVELVLHSPGTSMEVFVAALAATGLQQRELPPIVLSNQHLSAESLATLHRSADCFVTAARGEAWNLPAFDAMLAGRHVISQYGLGSDEFLVDTSADLIDGWESPAQVDVSYCARGGRGHQHEDDRRAGSRRRARCGWSRTFPRSPMRCDRPTPIASGTSPSPTTSRGASATRRSQTKY